MAKLVDGEEFSIIAKNKICFVTLFSPTTRNAISLRMASIMQSISIETDPQGSLFEKFLKEQNCLLIVVKSDVDGIFSSGGNLLELSKHSEDACQHYAPSIRAFCKLLHSTNLPSVTLLTGPSYGGGTELALATDFRWSIGENCDFHFTQTKFGIPAGWGGMLRLTELCPQLNHKKVSALLVGKITFTFQQMQQFGLIDKIIKNKKECLSALEHWVNQITDCPKNVREDLMMRQIYDKSKDLEDYDIEIFNKYFLKESHKRRINDFLKERKKK